MVLHRERISRQPTAHLCLGKLHKSPRGQHSTRRHNLDVPCLQQQLIPFEQCCLMLCMFLNSVVQAKMDCLLLTTPKQCTQAHTGRC